MGLLMHALGNRRLNRLQPILEGLIQGSQLLPDLPNRINPATAKGQHPLDPLVIIQGKPIHLIAVLTLALLPIKKGGVCVAGQGKAAVAAYLLMTPAPKTAPCRQDPRDRWEPKRLEVRLLSGWASTNQTVPSSSTRETTRRWPLAS